MHLNGPPGVGKSTLAERYVDAHAGVLRLDVDLLRPLVGGWRDAFEETGRQVRTLALAMASAHLRGGRDVVLPQYVGLVGEVERFERAAAEGGAAFVEVMLSAHPEAVRERFAARDDGGAWHRQVRESAAGTAAGTAEVEARLAEVLAHRPSYVVVEAGDGPDATYAGLLRALGSGPVAEQPADGR